MNYDISNLATQAEDETQFNEQDKLIQVYRELESYWLEKAYAPEKINTIYLARADWYYERAFELSQFSY